MRKIPSKEFAPTPVEIVVRILQRKIDRLRERGDSPDKIRDEVDYFCENMGRQRRKFSFALSAGHSREMAFKALSLHDIDLIGLDAFKPKVVWEAQQIVYPRNRLQNSTERGQYANLFGSRDVLNADEEKQKVHSKLKPFIVEMEL